MAATWTTEDPGETAAAGTGAAAAGFVAMVGNSSGRGVETVALTGVRSGAGSLSRAGGVGESIGTIAD
jgi:hypothetical protein